MDFYIPHLCRFTVAAQGGFFMRDTVQNLKLTHNIVLCGLMGALAIVLNYTTSIFITDYIRIGFSGLPNRVIDYLLGPYVGAIFGGVMDVLKYITKPAGGSFFPGYTISAMLGGLIYGSLLYKKPIRIWRVLSAEFLAKLFVNCGLNTLWLKIMYGSAFWAILPTRALKNLIMLPIDTAILFFMLTFISKLVALPEFNKFSHNK
jgi:ECF transporter S component (folate family)